ncbi:hypothetical protein FOCC_FOCC003234 [Frankliniella occidentalis]|nr:hypothetical protein FOCC_FOCC003234 [Frankliniella occidentalis]
MVFINVSSKLDSRFLDIALWQLSATFWGVTKCSELSRSTNGARTVWPRGDGGGERPLGALLLGPRGACGRLHLDQSVALTMQVVVGVEGGLKGPGADAEGAVAAGGHVHGGGLGLGWTPPEHRVALWSSPVGPPSVTRHSGHRPPRDTAAATHAGETGHY